MIHFAFSFLYHMIICIDLSICVRGPAISSSSGYGAISMLEKVLNVSPLKTVGILFFPKSIITLHADRFILLRLHYMLNIYQQR
jgi:hypothetical protein